MSVHLILGGARSGKSAYAQARAEADAQRLGAQPVYIATAQAWDEEMRQRIARHQADRGGEWRLVEEPLDLAAALGGLPQSAVVVVDCLTLWLSNSMLKDDGGHEARAQTLLTALEGFGGVAWVVSNEVGWGVVPDNALARRFRDEAGRLHQAAAKAADQVVLVVAGLPLFLKGGG